MDDLEEVRLAYAREVAPDPPALTAAFTRVRREDFLGPPPWRIVGGFSAREVSAPDAVQANVLIALDRSKGLNNGEPLLHGRLLAAAAAAPGETAVHVGAGSGYYSAILAELVGPEGMVLGFELDEALAARARANLAPWPQAEAIHRDACTAPLPAADVIYVSAGVAAPPRTWLDALAPGGRLVFPWRPSEEAALAVLVTPARHGGFAVTPLCGAWFVPCIGAAEEVSFGPPLAAARAWAARGLWPVSVRPPDATALASYRDLWFSSAAPD